MLKGHCGMNKQEKQAQKRGKKIIAGKEIQQSDLINNDKTLPGTSKVLPVPVLVPVPAKRRKVQEVEPSSDSESGGSVSYQNSSTGPGTTRTSYGSAGADSESPVVSTKSQYEPDQWIVVKYEGKKGYLNYIGKILDVKPRRRLLKVQFVKKQPGSKYFKFTDKEADVDSAVPYNAGLGLVSIPASSIRLTQSSTP